MWIVFPYLGKVVSGQKLAVIDSAITVKLAKPSLPVDQMVALRLATPKLNSSSPQLEIRE